MKRQGLNISIEELSELKFNLIDQSVELNKELGIETPIDNKKKWMIGIINKTPEQSDTWEIEQ